MADEERARYLLPGFQHIFSQLESQFPIPAFKREYRICQHCFGNCGSDAIKVGILLGAVRIEKSRRLVEDFLANVLNPESVCGQLVEDRFRQVTTVELALEGGDDFGDSGGGKDEMSTQFVQVAGSFIGFGVFKVAFVEEGNNRIRVRHNERSINPRDTGHDG